MSIHKPFYLIATFTIFLTCVTFDTIFWYDFFCDKNSRRSTLCSILSRTNETSSYEGTSSISCKYEVMTPFCNRSSLLKINERCVYQDVIQCYYNIHDTCHILNGPYDISFLIMALSCAVAILFSLAVLLFFIIRTRRSSTKI